MNSFRLLLVSWVWRMRLSDSPSQFYGMKCSSFCSALSRVVVAMTHCLSVGLSSWESAIE